MKNISLLILFIILFKCSIGQNITKEDSTKIDEMFYFYKGLPGAQIGVFQDGEIIYSQSYGLSSIESKEKISENLS